MSTWISLPFAGTGGARPPIGLDTFLIATTGAAAVLLAGGHYAGMPAPIEAVVAVVGLAAGGWKATLETLPRAIRGKPDVDLLMVLAAVAATVLGHYGEAVILLFLFSLAHHIEEMAEEKSKSAIARLLKDRPTHATLVRDDSILAVPICEIVPGDVVRLSPGEMACVDGVVVSGESAVDESSLTGESTPILKRGGDTIIAGSVNTNGSLDIAAAQPVRESTLERIVRCAEEAQERKTVFQSTVERLENRYAMGILVVVAHVIGLQWLDGVELGTAFYRGIVLLVVASPCALVLSTPSAVLAAIAAGARRGIVFKGGATLEKFADVDVVVFDKTGTLTTGKPVLTDVVVSPSAPPEVDENGLIAYAAALEARSEHVLAREILRAAAARGIAIEATERFASEPGMGVRAKLGGNHVWLGNARLFGRHGTQPPAWVEETRESLEAQGKTVIIVHRCKDTLDTASGCEWLGLLAFRDAPRSDAASAIEQLRQAGIKRIVMLTGDNASAAQAVATHLGMDEFHAELLPGQKTAWVDRLERTCGKVLMVGDGINDVPALARATAGCVMGNGGIDAALSNADCVLTGEDLGRLVTALHLSRRATAIARQNLVVAAGAMLVLSCGQLFWDIPLATGVLCHEGSTVLVCLNGLRILR